MAEKVEHIFYMQIQSPALHVLLSIVRNEPQTKLEIAPKYHQVWQKQNPSMALYCS